MQGLVTYEERLKAVRHALRRRRLIWFGIRGEDAEPLRAVPEFQASFAITAALRSAAIPARQNVALELDLGVRVDLDRYDLDFDPSSAATGFRTGLRRVAEEPCVLLTYRPNGFVSSLAFALSETVTLAGMLKDRQAGFEFKPWVETAMRAAGVDTVDWTYVPDSERDRARRLLLRTGPLVLRVSRASGGVGMVVARTNDDIDQHWPEQSDTFVGVAPYLDEAIPVNFAGCVFPSGILRLHPASLQLIGIDGCTPLPFGYCGNDFGAVRVLDRSVLNGLDEMGRRVGAWLASERYVGAFGVDAMIHRGRVLFTEVNARFQGSSALSALIVRDLGLPDLYLDHLAAFLDVSPGDVGPSLWEYSQLQSAHAHIVVHNSTADTLSLDLDAEIRPWPRSTVPVQLPEAVPVAPGAVLGRLLCSQSVTDDGYRLNSEADLAIARIRGMFKVRND